MDDSKFKSVLEKKIFLCVEKCQSEITKDEIRKMVYELVPFVNDLVDRRVDEKVKEAILKAFGSTKEDELNEAEPEEEERSIIPEVK